MLNLLIALPGGTEFFLLAVVLFGVVLFSVFFWIKCIVEIAKSEFKQKDQQIIWLLVTILMEFVGALIYYFAGRSSRITA